MAVLAPQVDLRLAHGPRRSKTGFEVSVKALHQSSCRGIVDRPQAHDDRGGPSLKEAAGWMAEKLSRFKLSHESGGEFGTFEALEALVLGISGKLALWRALVNVAPSYSPLRALDFDRLIARAESQLKAAEERRLQSAVTALSRLES